MMTIQQPHFKLLHQTYTGWLGVVRGVVSAHVVMCATVVRQLP